MEGIYEEGHYDIDFLWEDGNLTKISIAYKYTKEEYTEKTREEVENTEETTEYLITYDTNIPNPRNQFLYCFSKLFTTDKIVQMVSPTGILGKGTANMPTTVKKFKNGEFQGLDEISYILNYDANGNPESIDAEKYNDETYFYYYIPSPKAPQPVKK